MRLETIKAHFDAVITMNFLLKLCRCHFIDLFFISLLLFCILNLMLFHVLIPFINNNLIDIGNSSGNEFKYLIQ